MIETLHWRHNVRDGISNHQPNDCLLNRLFRRRSKKTSKFRVTGLCEGNSPVTWEFPAQRAINAESVSIRWRHHDQECSHTADVDLTSSNVFIFNQVVNCHNVTPLISLHAVDFNNCLSICYQIYLKLGGCTHHGTPQAWLTSVYNIHATESPPWSHWFAPTLNFIPVVFEIYVCFNLLFYIYTYVCKLGHQWWAPTLTCGLGPEEQILVTFQSKHSNFHLRTCI